MTGISCQNNRVANVFSFIRNLITTPLPSPTACGDNILIPADAQVENQDATSYDAGICKPNGEPRQSLTFSYHGWSDEELAKLDAWLQKLTPVMEQDYGKPRFGDQVTIIKLDCPQTQYLSCGKQILICENKLPPISELSHELAHAYHDGTFVVKEEGFAVLLSFYTSFQYWYTYGPEEINNFLNPASLYSSSFTIYDFNNQKAIAQTPSDCYTEDQLGKNLYQVLWNSIIYNQPFLALAKLNATLPNFMSDFNNALYQSSTSPSSSQELLDFIHNQIAPPNHTVEGKSFTDWFKAQSGLNEISDNGYKILVRFAHANIQFLNYVMLQGIFVWEDRLLNLPPSFCALPLQRFVYSGNANIKIEDFQGLEVYSSSVDIKDGISKDEYNLINLTTPTSPQRMRMVISITTPEGAIKESEFYFPFCTGDTSFCQPNLSIQGIINGFPLIESLSGNIDIEVNAYAWKTGELTNIKQSTPYSLGYFNIDLSDYPTLLEAEKTFIKFNVKSNQGNQSSFVTERIWLVPYKQVPFFVALDAT